MPLTNTLQEGMAAKRVTTETELQKLYQWGQCPVFPHMCVWHNKSNNMYFELTQMRISIWATAIVSSRHSIKTQDLTQVCLGCWKGHHINTSNIITLRRWQEIEDVIISYTTCIRCTCFSIQQVLPCAPRWTDCSGTACTGSAGANFSSTATACASCTSSRSSWVQISFWTLLSSIYATTSIHWRVWLSCTTLLSRSSNARTHSRLRRSSTSWTTWRNIFSFIISQCDYVSQHPVIRILHQV